MAPCIITMQSTEEKGLRKLKKPVIEKMRRDRINSSIEQLRILLEKEFQKQQLPSKPEKADILEMTVSFLQQHLAAKSAPSPSLSYREGHSRCLQESLHFLSLQPQSEAQVNLLHHIQGPQCTPEVAHLQVQSPYDSHINQTTVKDIKALWRPW
ncbi:transcription factor HES-5-like [Bombina bombina]|uniref:transcription factor HES-5-like n=1 Tax=Bombina bombina TaxID=8345 RepID=UPI00235A6E91|nr:transcription factor HES-5-like [Bombina bombina]